MCNLRNVQGDRSKAAKKRVQAKKSQVLLQIISLQRMRNPKSLVYWSLIQAVAYYSWGVGHTALDANNFWGNSCSSRSRDKCLLKLMSKLAERRKCFFSDLDAITFCIDDFQRGQHVKHQRGSHSSSFLSETHQMAHRIFEFTDTQYNEHFTPISFTSPMTRTTFTCTDERIQN